MLLLLSATPLSALAEGALTTGAVGRDGAERDSVVADVASLSAPADPTGAGRWSRGACLLCAASFVMVGGTSILGLAAAALAFPEFAAACGATCAYAFG